MENNIQNVMVPMLNIVQQILFDDDEAEENVLEKVDGFVEYTATHMQDHQFKRHFRMTPDTFEHLLVQLHNALQINVENKGGYPRTLLEKEVMVTIWYIGNMESIRSVSDRFGVTKSTCWAILQRTCNLLLKVNQRNRIISWPNQERQALISANFNQNGFAGVVGCIDGSHIKITAPKEHPNSYVNRKSYHSLLLQGVCDHKMLFTDVYAGEAGSLHDLALYRRSDIFEGINRGEIVFFNDTFLLGDLAYKLETHLIVGFKDNGHLTLRQKNFNVQLSKTRVKIENAFALLKGRYRRLKFLETVRLDLAVLFIVSATIMHNICILNGDPFEDLLDIVEERRVEQENNPNYVGDPYEDNVIVNNAILKRNNILNNLPLIIRQ